MAYDKVYVDEIQDYTQVSIAIFLSRSGTDFASKTHFRLERLSFKIEIALFFMLCRHHSDLFFDPAQSVVEDSDFRCEDIRTVAHHLFQNEKRGNKKQVIPTSP